MKTPTKCTCLAAPGYHAIGCPLGPPFSEPPPTEHRPTERIRLVGGEDWTRNSDGRSNSSNRFLFLVSEVERLIRNSAHDIVGGHIESVARLIMAQLAHKHGMRPSEELDEPSAGKEREG